MQMKTSLQQQLFTLQDPSYREFQCRLMPTKDPAVVIGVRTPQLRRFAGSIAGSPEAEDFLSRLPHTYYEEDNLHGFLLEKRKDYTQLIGELDRFLPYVDNWATCDEMNPKIFAKHLPQLAEQTEKWLGSDHVYTVRFGIRMLMNFFLEEAFDLQYPEAVAAVVSEEYYVRMMQAWYFATALAKQYDAVLPFLQENRLACWTHNKTIQKAIESYRITPGQKCYLRTLKRKEG